jgi:hypothetical protein
MVISYIYYWNFQFLINVIIIQTKIHLPRRPETIFVVIIFMFSGFIAPKDF